MISPRRQLPARHHNKAAASAQAKPNFRMLNVESGAPKQPRRQERTKHSLIRNRQDDGIAALKLDSEVS